MFEGAPRRRPGRRSGFGGFQRIELKFSFFITALTFWYFCDGPPLRSSQKYKKAEGRAKSHWNDS